eukprot:COSAG02_NODE_3250_length_7094_cov_10.309507_1_plen_71_part_00
MIAVTCYEYYGIRCSVWVRVLECQRGARAATSRDLVRVTLTVQDMWLLSTILDSATAVWYPTLFIIHFSY